MTLQKAKDFFPQGNNKQPTKVVLNLAI